MKNYFLFILFFLLFSCNKDKIQDIEGVEINPSFSKATDQEGNEYKTVILNGLEWFGENLRTSTYCNGDSILNIADDSLWISTEDGAWSYHENDEFYNEPYGKLYNFYAIADARGVCPCGWRVPNSKDWENIIIYLGGYVVAGGKLKEKGTEHWQEPNFAATNESGFSATPNSIRSHIDGSFSKLDTSATFWGNEYSWFGTYPISAIYILEKDRGRIQRLHTMLKSGGAIRCVRDL